MRKKLTRKNAMDTRKQVRMTIAISVLFFLSAQAFIVIKPSLSKILNIYRSIRNGNSIEKAIVEDNDYYPLEEKSIVFENRSDSQSKLYYILGTDDAPGMPSWTHFQLAYIFYPVVPEEISAEEFRELVLGKKTRHGDLFVCNINPFSGIDSSGYTIEQFTGYIIITKDD